MKVILLERVERLGALGDVVNVRDGFARNYLLPRSKALRASEANLKVFEAQRQDIEARNANARDAAEKASKKIDGESYVIIRQAGESGQLYGSVSGRDVAEAVQAGGGQVDRAQVVLDRPIKALGVHPVKVRLHPEVTITINVNVARSRDEAERQARGENVITSQLDEERFAAQQAAEELFEGGAGQALVEPSAEAEAEAEAETEA
jgi:large subunit ribosomal protein L9